MIEVDRKSVSEPAEFTRRAVSATKTLRLHVVRGETFRKQNQLPLNEELLAAPDLLDALQGLFRGCCAFCETPLLDSEKKFAAHFRPRQRASQLGGKVDPLHYWWLTYAWSNLYSICSSCQSIRGTRFPVRGKRAALGSNTGIKSERALLLDPCAEDPEAVLLFTDDGLVASTSERGSTTIDVFGLNRASLVQARRDHCRRVDHIGDQFLDRNQPEQWDEQKFIAAVMGET
ncbi:MAG TPA: hypothetical protein VJP84_11550, partial [Steroidobacteraceae bacterium]|nr:hypothetical protein [Steroidobacteraceae bacterium]